MGAYREELENMARIMFEADSQAELEAMVRRWLPAAEAGLDAVEAQAELGDAPWDDQLREVLSGIKGRDSRKLIREVAQAAMAGGTVHFGPELLTRYAKPKGVAFAGMVGGPNRRMRRIADRDLIRWDAVGSGYRMNKRDADVVLEMWPEA